MIKVKNTTVRWHKYTADSPALPKPFASVLVRKTGVDGAFFGVFSAYHAGDAAAAALWHPHSHAFGPLPIEPGDWWAEYPEGPE